MKVLRLLLSVLIALSFCIKASVCFLRVDPSIRSNKRLVVILQSSSTTKKSINNKLIGSLGPPEPLCSLPVGETLPAFRKRHEDGSFHDFSVTKVANDPPMFLLQNFLSLQDCQTIQHQATAGQTMKSAQTVTEGDVNSRTNCQVAWLGYNHHPLIGSITQATANMFLSETTRKNPQSGVEDLQVLEYKKDGEFVLHHDSECRVLTIIYYLNGVAGTWFPLADNGSSQPLNKDEALKHCRDLEVGTNGIVLLGDNVDATTDSSKTISINPGDAIAFYNYRDDGRMNWNAIHAGLPVDNGVKWIANHWFRCDMLSTLSS